MKSAQYEIETELDDEEEISLLIEPAVAGVRLDHLLVQQIPDVSRSRIISSIKSGLILVDGEHCKAGYKLKAGQKVTGSLFKLPPLSVTAEKIDFPILFEDNSLLVLSKPPGLVVHPGSGNYSGTLVNGLLYHCANIADVGDAVRPGIVHRLDKDTSGIMVVAKNEVVHRQLVDMFKNRDMDKEYLAIVHGVPNRAEGRIVAPIGRHSVNRQKMAVREGAGRYAASSWRIVDVYGSKYSLVQVTIETGRTHQIRVHMAHIKHPVAGDTVYGPGRDNRMFPRQMLHAFKLAFKHPITDRQMSFTAPLWEDMQSICDLLNENRQ